MKGFENVPAKRMSDFDKTEVQNRLKNLSSPPRPLPLGIKCKLMMGGTAAMVGLIFAGLGMLFVLLFVLNSRVIPAIRLIGANAETTATVIKIEATSASVGGSKTRRGTPVFKVHFKFEVPGGKEYTQYSYVTGGLYNSENQLVTEGHPVKVQYLASNPKFSRIVGARYSTFGAFVLLTLIFPVIGIIFVITGYRKGFKQIHLLKNGFIADGKITGKVATGTKVNNIPEMKYFFEYTNDGGATCKGESRSLPRPEIGDEKYEPVVYVNNGKVYYAELVDALPKNILLDAQGNWTSRSNFRSLAAFFIFEPLLWLLIIGFLAGVVAQMI